MGATSASSHAGGCENGFPILPMVFRLAPPLPEECSHEVEAALGLVTRSVIHDPLSPIKAMA